MNLILFLIIGGLAGFIAGKIMRDGGFGLLGNIVVGVIGSFIGGMMLGVLGVGDSGIIMGLIGAVLGAVVLIYVVGLIKGRS